MAELSAPAPAPAVSAPPPARSAAAAPRRRRLPGGGTAARVLVVLGGWVALWWALAAGFEVSADFMPTPPAVVERLWILVIRPMGDGSLLHHLAMSVQRFLLGFAAAVAVGVPLGLLMGYLRPVDRLVTPVFELLSPIPPIAWAPFAILWFGASVGAQSFVIGLAAFAPILINAHRAVRLVDPGLIAAARSLGAGAGIVLFRVILPASVPMVVGGLRIGLAAGWMALIAAEIVAGDGSSSGLGYLILQGQRTLHADLTIGAMLIIGVVGTLLDLFMRGLEARLLRWR